MNPALPAAIAIGILILAAWYLLSYISRQHEKEEVRVRATVADAVMRKLSSIAAEQDPSDERQRIQFRTLGEFCYSLLNAPDIEELTGGYTPEYIYRSWMERARS